MAPQAHEDGPAYFPTVAILSLGASTVIRFTRKRPDAEMHAAPSSSAGEPSDEPPQQAAGSAAPLEPGWLGDAAAGFAAGSCGDASSPAEPAPPFPLPESLGVFLQPRSLLLFSGDAYTAYLHRIEEADADVLDESVANAPPELRGEALVARGGPLLKVGDLLAVCKAPYAAGAAAHCNLLSGARADVRDVCQRPRVALVSAALRILSRPQPHHRRQLLLTLWLVCTALLPQAR